MMPNNKANTSSSSFSPTSLQSPVKATVIPSPKDGSGCTAFVYYAAEHKSAGLTPDGSRKMPLQEHEGKNHPKFKSPGSTIYRDENDFYTATTFDAKYKALLLAFTTLKCRLDYDYQCKPEHRDRGHYTASYLLIQKCIHMLQEMVLLPEEVQSFPFLNRLNRAILTTSFDERLYNPIDMLPCYLAKDYRTYDKQQVRQASELRTLLTVANIHAVTVNLAALYQIGVPRCSAPIETPTPLGSLGLFADTMQNQSLFTSDCTAESPSTPTMMSTSSAPPLASSTTPKRSPLSFIPTQLKKRKVTLSTQKENESQPVNASPSLT